MSNINEPLLEGQKAEDASLGSRISSYLFRDRMMSNRQIGKFYSGRIMSLMIWSCISYTMNKRFFDSETPGSLYEVGQTLKDEGNELYSFIDASCSIYKQDLALILVSFLFCPLNELLRLLNFVYALLMLI